ncbi:hypothetical protein L1857_30775 [Amycolatopsis thermalba]|uniref:Uncharacterized protein n=1 Tax=Amycolatopsis thermalba TaxID=944492 RepID=A0ABY4P3D5_9PSEU|nr:MULTISPECIES: hypothetical protein [Amycolatopsis]UQS26875.1 hypothetical protein L1857_30775 [Amycolatopsis thermalba]
MMEIAFATFAIVLTCAGVAVFVISYPWVADGVDDVGEIVATIGAANVFSSLVFAAMAIPQERSASIAPGYTADTMRRRGPWLVCLLLVLISAGLFCLSSIRPEPQVAIGAGLITAGGFSLVWLYARILLKSADYLAIAERQATFISKAFWTGRKVHRRNARAWLKLEDQSDENIDLLSQEAVLRWLAGSLRHLEAGMRAGFTEHKPSLSAAFASEMVKLFRAYVDDCDGKVGGQNGPIQVVLQAHKDLARVANDRGADFDQAARHCLEKLVDVATSNTRSRQYSAVRSLIVRTYEQIIEMMWNNDESLIPAAACSNIGKLVHRYLQVGAISDAQDCIDMLGSLIVKALETGRPHISLAATEQLVGALAPTVRVGNKYARQELLQAFFEGVHPLIAVHPLVRISFNDPTELILPGIGIGFKGLQDVLWTEVRLTEENTADFAEVVIEWINGIISDYAELDSERNRHPLRDALAVLLCIQLRMISVGYLEVWPLASLEAATSWVFAQDDPSRFEKLLVPEVAELVWSCIMCAGFAEQDPELIRSTCARVLGKIEQNAPSKLAGRFVATFVTGLFLAAGRTLEEANAYLDSGGDRRNRIFGRTYDGPFIEGFGNAPSMNRNATRHHPAIIEAINRWIFLNFPEFRAKY